MRSNTLLPFYGLKWNPFTPDVPVEGLLATRPIEDFVWRVEHLVYEGGFALITGDYGAGKSVALRILAQRLRRLRDVSVGVLTRPQSSISDCYRELGDLFNVNLSPRNRWGGFKSLRDRWQAHLDSTLTRPVLLIDEAQFMAPVVLSELRMLTSTQFDTAHYLSVILCGDTRLTDLLRHQDLVALASRMRTRLVLDYASPDQLLALLKHAMAQAGNAKLMTEPLLDTLVEHAVGNYRVLMSMGAQLLVEGLRREQVQLDEKLYLEVFATPPTPSKGTRSARTPRAGTP